MSIPHQHAADDEIVEITSRWSSEDANSIIASAEKVAEDA